MIVSNKLICLLLLICLSQTVLIEEAESVKRPQGIQTPKQNQLPSVQLVIPEFKAEVLKGTQNLSVYAVSYASFSNFDTSSCLSIQLYIDSIGPCYAYDKVCATSDGSRSLGASCVLEGPLIEDISVDVIGQAWITHGKNGPIIASSRVKTTLEITTK